MFRQGFPSNLKSSIMITAIKLQVSIFSNQNYTNLNSFV